MDFFFLHLHITPSTDRCSNRFLLSSCIAVWLFFCPELIVKPYFASPFTMRPFRTPTIFIFELSPISSCNFWWTLSKRQINHGLGRSRSGLGWVYRHGRRQHSRRLHAIKLFRGAKLVGCILQFLKRAFQARPFILAGNMKFLKRIKLLWLSLVVFIFYFLIFVERNIRTHIHACIHTIAYWGVLNSMKKGSHAGERTQAENELEEAKNRNRKGIRRSKEQEQKRN